MTDRWAARFPRSSLQAALPLRLRAGIKVCEQGETIWLSGDNLEQVDPMLRRIPDVIRYSVQTSSTITRIGLRIPEGELPAESWSNFSAVARLVPQPAALPASVKASISITLKRPPSSLGKNASGENSLVAGGGSPGLSCDTRGRPGLPPPAIKESAASIDYFPNSSGRPLNEEGSSALLVTINDWVQFATTAPQIRLDSLRFAVRGDGEILILGSPLPPIRGTYLVNHAGLLLPSGYTWEPDLEPKIMRQSMNLAGNDLALFDIDGSYELIPAESVVAATRSSARRSLASFKQPAGAQ